MARVVALLVLVVCVAATPADYEAYKQRFKKHYVDPKEDHVRYMLFEESVERIQKANDQNGEKVFGLTWTSDLKAEEKFKKGYNRSSSRSSSSGPGASGVVQLTASKELPFLDWRQTEVITPVKNQGACGSCWAFSAVEAIESQYILANGLKYGVEFSVEQIIECAHQDGALGCFGGDPKLAYAYIQTVPGLSNEWNWPYIQSMVNLGFAPNCSKAKEGSINGSNWQQQGVYAQVSGYKWATPRCDGTCDHQDLGALASSLELGPLSICVNASIWNDYVGGVVRASACPADYSGVDHCVQLVGYNRLAKVPYWIVRNSWSPTWGEDGYIYLEMANNTCGLADEATIPIVTHVDPGAERAQALLRKATSVKRNHFFV